VKLRAMDPFFTTKKRGLGTGLGLSLVRGVVQGAGGTLLIDSAPGEGTTVAILVPVVEHLSPAGRGSQAAPVAEVSLPDRRTAAFVSALLSAAGLQVSRVSAPRDPAGVIWVTEATADALAQARGYAATGRQIVVVGGSPEWDRLGAITIPDAEDFEEIRSAVGEAVSAALGE
jgi:hypothetical protein